MAIRDILISQSRKDLHDPQFREVIEKHLKTLPATAGGLVEVGRALQLRYRGDFYGLLKEHQQEYSHWWVILRFNGMTSPTEYNGSASYYIPDLGTISSILRNWNNTYVL